MLKQIKNIEGVTALSKEKQQELNAGSITSYYCVGGEEIFSFTPTCPASHPAPHPTHGDCICCSGYWRKAGGDDDILL
jgi:hypothetical protein